MKNYSIGEFSKIAGVSIQTLRDWHKKGDLIPSYISSGGTRYYCTDQLNLLLGIQKQEKDNKKVIGYCRVSSNKQKDDLKRQVENMTIYLLAQGNPFEIITDIGSGINYKNKGLNRLLDKVIDKKVDKIVLLYKDRLVRFGFELIENVCSKFNTEIEIIDTTKKTEEQELVEDLIQIVTVFSCRLQGKRANQAKKMIKELLEDDTIQKG